MFSKRYGDLATPGPHRASIMKGRNAPMRTHEVVCRCDIIQLLGVANTSGFFNTRQLNLHHAEHGAQLGASSAAEYQAMADNFLGGAKPAHVHECRRRQGDILWYDPSTEAYGVLDRNGVIRTYFKPIPCALVPAAQRSVVRRAGRCHGEATNLLYFQRECQRW